MSHGKNKRWKRDAKRRKRERIAAKRLQLATQYEEVVREILQTCLHHFDLEVVESKGKLTGKAAHPVEIDVIAYTTQKRLFLVECRRHLTHSIPQEQVYALVGKMVDLDAVAGMMVSPRGFQIGAKKVAQAHRVHLAILNEDATRRSYVLKLADRLFARAEMQGGIQLGGSSEVGVRFFAEGSGGPTLGGSADAGAEFPGSASGGVAVGGTAKVGAHFFVHGSGGAALGG